MSVITNIFRGYSRLLLNSGKSIITGLKITFFILFILGLSVLIVYPLWYLADTSPYIYSKFVVITIITLGLCYLLYRLIRSIKTNGFVLFFRDKILKFFKRLFAFVMIISGVAATIYVFTKSLIIGLVASFFILFILGIVKFAKQG